MNALVLLVALLIDRIFGDPAWLWSRIPHPVAVFGLMIDWMDRTWNKQGSEAGGAAAADVRQKGLVVVLVLTGVSIVAGLIVERLATALPLGSVIVVALTAVLIAHRSLLDHVLAVEDALRRDGLAGGREAVARIVGRDVERLDESGVARAAIESLAENFSDGVVAPAFWFLLFGLPGLFVYKAVNTADSMIGHRTDKYRDFGWASAKFDDILNWAPARLSAALITLGTVGRGGDLQAIWAVVRNDASQHRSPNAGWPEAAMAAVLGVALGGPRSYEASQVDGAWLNEAGERSVGPDDIGAALKAADRAWFVVLAAIAVILFVFGQ